MQFKSQVATCLVIIAALGLISVTGNWSVYYFTCL